MEELLKKLGITDDVVQNIIKGMKDSKIYVTKEENIEDRYNKIKGQKEDLESQLKTANSTLKDLQKNNQDNESLQTKVKGYEDEIKTLKNQAVKREKEFVIKAALSKAGATDIDYLVYKLGDIDKLDMDSNGAIKDIDSKIKELKENNTNFFKTENSNDNKQDQKIIVNKLQGNNNPPQAFTMEQIKSMSPEEINKNWDTIKDLKFE